MRWALIATIVELASIIFTAAIRNDWSQTQRSLMLFALLWPVFLLLVVYPLSRAAVTNTRRGMPVGLLAFLLAIIALNPLGYHTETITALPLMLILAAAFNITADRPAPKPSGLCLSCGYDLRSLPSDGSMLVCPECGTLNQPPNPLAWHAPKLPDRWPDAGAS
jgi:hypothetical protein